MSSALYDLRDFLMAEHKNEIEKFNKSLMRCKELERQIVNIDAILFDGIKKEGEG